MISINQMFSFYPNPNVSIHVLIYKLKHVYLIGDVW